MLRRKYKSKFKQRMKASAQFVQTNIGRRSFRTDLVLPARPVQSEDVAPIFVCTDLALEVIKSVPSNKFACESSYH